MIASIWDVVRAELLRLETQGKDDGRDSWMGNAIKAVNRLEEHCVQHNAYVSQAILRDASRYRWLRGAYSIMPGTPGKSPIEWYCGTEADAAIDAAMICTAAKETP